jgi:hypothetical protein
MIFISKGRQAAGGGGGTYTSSAEYNEIRIPTFESRRRLI